MKWRAVAVSLGSILAVLAGSHLLGESRSTLRGTFSPFFRKNASPATTPDAPQSGLVMESVEAMLEGGEKAGPSILAGDSAGSPLVRHLRGELEPQMPVGGDPLPEAQIALIAAWIDQMAPAAAPDGPPRQPAKALPPMISRPTSSRSWSRTAWLATAPKPTRAGWWWRRRQPS